MKEVKSLMWGALQQIAWLGRCDKVKVSEKVEASHF